MSFKILNWTLNLFTTMTLSLFLFSGAQAQALEINFWSNTNFGEQERAIHPIYHCGQAFGVPFRSQGRLIVYPRFVDGEFNEYCEIEEVGRRNRLQRPRRRKLNRNRQLGRGDYVIPRRRSHRQSPPIVSPRRNQQRRVQCDQTREYCVGTKVVIAHKVNRCETAFPGRISSVLRRGAVSRFNIQVSDEQVNGTYRYPIGKFTRVARHKLFTLKPIDSRFRLNDLAVFKNGFGQVIGFNRKTMSGSGGHYSVLIRRHRSSCVEQVDVNRTLGTSIPCINFRSRRLRNNQRKTTVCLGNFVTAVQGPDRLAGYVQALQSQPDQLVAIQQQNGRTKIVSVQDLLSLNRSGLSKNQRKENSPRRKKTLRRRAPINGDLQKEVMPEAPVRKKKDRKRKKVPLPIRDKKERRVRPGFVHDVSNKKFQLNDIVVEMVDDPSIQKVSLVTKKAPKGKRGNIRLSNKHWYKANRLVNLTKILGRKRANRYFETLKKKSIRLYKTYGFEVKDQGGLILPAASRWISNEKKPFRANVLIQPRQKLALVLTLKDNVGIYGVSEVLDQGRIKIKQFKEGKLIKSWTFKAGELDKTTGRPKSETSFLYIEGLRPKKK